MFKEVQNQVDFPELEHRILKFWVDTSAFEKRVELSRGKMRWSFLDGPITANNPMGVHHAWGRTYKDLFQRYRAMRGFDLRYQNGFDCQGLWIEVEVEKELGFKSKKDIETYGIAKFVERCKQRVLHYSAVQTEQSIRLGYWMDWNDPEFLRKLESQMEDPETVVEVQGRRGLVSGKVEQVVGRLGSQDIGGSYFTFSDKNNYTIWALLKKCHEHGWIYKGKDVMPWCPRCSTALSQHEITTDGYRELTHLGLTVRFRLRGRKDESLLVWTTTPWTLSSNVAVAVHPQMIYVKVRQGNEAFYLAKATISRTLKGDYEVVEEFTGERMLDWTYDGPFDEFPVEKEMGAVDAHRVIPWKEVSEAEGTGIVHIAPGCGKEDFELSTEYDLPAISPLDEYGVFIKGFDWLSGLSVYQTHKQIIEDLRRKGLLYKAEDYTHRYPVCWRCGNELVFRLVDEWFISMGEKLDKPLEQISREEKQRNLRYQIIDVVQKTSWVPPFGLRQEIDWLLNMEDWMISKKRYWGLTLPIWVCQKCGTFDVVGSKEELESRAVSGWDEFDGHSPHRPWIDAVKIACPKCGADASRIHDVGNPWLDAGIVAYSTLDYLNDREYWDKWFPADMICESLPGQFRNWFYSLLAMSTIMEGRPPFKTCIGHGLVLAEDGREMHKSWGNAIWFDDAAESMGADVMRWMYCRTNPETNMRFGYGGASETRRRFLIPLWNIYSFFITYARLDRWTPENTRVDFSVLDRWIISKLHMLVQQVTDSLESFNVPDATARLEKYVDELSKWYVRRSRRRFWKSTKDIDKMAAYTTLYTCLTTLLKLLAPFIPFVTEEMYQNLVCAVMPDALESVHHNDWPSPDLSLIDEELMEDMDLAVKVSELGRSLRSASGIRLRQPLAEAKVFVDANVLKRIERVSSLIEDELNVKDLVLCSDRLELIDYIVRPIPEQLGKRYGAMLRRIEEVVGKMDSNSLALRFQRGLSVDVNVNGTTVSLDPQDVDLRAQPKKGYVFAEKDGIILSICTEIDEKLWEEGLARDIVRHIQNQRKMADFNIDDRIETYYESGKKLTHVFSIFGEYIAEETLSTTLKKGKVPKGAYVKELSIGGESLKLGLVRLQMKESGNKTEQ